MLCTKAYVIKPETLCWSCPAEIEPYIKLYDLEERKKDEQAWLQGRYVYDATLVAIDNAFGGRKSKARYVEKPFTRLAKENSGEMSHEEKMRKVKQLFMKLDIMKSNYDLTHPKKED